MTALQVILIVFFSIMGVGMLIFILMLARYYLTPIGGDFIVFMKPEDDNETIYRINLDSHPLTWTKKTIRFRVVIKK